MNERMWDGQSLVPAVSLTHDGDCALMVAQMCRSAGCKDRRSRSSGPAANTKLVRRLMQQPHIFVVELNWPSTEPLPESVAAVIDSIGA